MLGPFPEDRPSPRGGIVRGARRPAGWVAPGPRPAIPVDDLEMLWPGPDEDLCWLAGDWRILQRTDGHRFSLDDLVTAQFAAAAASLRSPARALDLGCGIGTVLLFLAWRFPQARLTGVEVQELSAGLARRSIAWNGVANRCDVRLSDFRDPTALPPAGRFDLITGTPPYFPRGTGVESDQVQRAPCRFEHRGGVEAYCEAAARHLADGGTFVACESAGQDDRVRAAAAAAGLAITRWQDVIPRAGKPPLFVVFAMQRQTDVGAAEIQQTSLVVRDDAGQRTPAFVALRADMGVPP